MKEITYLSKEGIRVGRVFMEDLEEVCTRHGYHGVSQRRGTFHPDARGRYTIFEIPKKGIIYADTIDRTNLGPGTESNIKLMGFNETTKEFTKLVNDIKTLTKKKYKAR